MQDRIETPEQLETNGTMPAASSPPPRPAAHLQPMRDEMDIDTIVLTDTAPLPASGETEYLARFVDCAMVVIQSGLSTRAQLREVAQTLQRLNVAAVGFVVNDVSIEKADPSFRQSVRAVEQRLTVQNRLQTRRSPRSRPSAPHHGEAPRSRLL
jgi:Mrp family chromosome partitioning ATPase